MSGLFRFGVSIPKDLIKKFDLYLKKHNYNNRSEAIRDLIRNALIKYKWKKGEEVAGTITMIYDHHYRELVNKLIDIQHNFLKEIISTQHIHLTHRSCLEIIVVKGKSEKIISLSDKLKSIKGVQHLTFSVTSNEDI